MTIHVNYATQEEKDASLAQEREQLAALQEQLSAAEEVRKNTYADRRVARQQLISAKAGLVMAQQSGIESSIANAEAAVAAAQVNLDRAAGVHDAARDKADTLLDQVTRAENQLSDNSNAPVFEQQSPAAQAEAQETAESSTGDDSAEELDDNETANLEDNEEDGDETEPKLLNEQNDDQDEIERENQRLLSKVPNKTRAIDHTPGSNEAAEKNKSSTHTGSVPTYIPRDNPLRGYSTYTYSIALFILTQQDINLLTTNPEEWSPGTGRIKNCLIASGGKNEGPYKRNSNFTDDFYFTDLKMTTVIGLNNRSKSTNAIEITFGITEPYGMSLLDRIMATADDIAAPNFKAMPYLLEIDFYGYDDTGKAEKLESQRKRIPIQIIEFKIKASTKGAEYAVRAVPWNHQALSQSAATTPINLEVKASTVSEFFFNNVAKDQASVTATATAKQNASSALQRRESEIKAEEEADTKARQEESDRQARAAGEDPATSPKVSPAARKPESQAELVGHKGVINHAFAVSSYCGGVNAWFTDLVLKKQRGTRDEILVKFVPSPPDCPYDIASSKITVPNNKDITRSAVKEDKPLDAAAAAARDANRVFTDASAFAISAGTNITQVIDMVMRNSSYITDQVKDPQNARPQDLAEKEGKPLWWYKVIPSVELGPYDYALNKFSTVTTYYISPYRVYDSKHPNGPSVSPRGSIKKYYYSYTGKNLDIIDFQIDFDTLFYTAVTAGSAKWEATQITKAEQQSDDAKKVPLDSKSSAADLVNRQTRMVSTQPQATGGGGTQNGVKPILAGDIQKSQYSNSRGDMLNLQLKITGDPELIKQDDIYTNPAQGGYADQSRSTETMENGSIVMDSGEILALVEFRTIVDMDQSTGLPRQDQYLKNSVFTGLYRMLTIDNVFANGKFEQTVNMVRIPDSINSGSIDEKKGQENTTSQSAPTKSDDDNAPGTRSIASEENSSESDPDEFRAVDMSDNQEDAEPVAGVNEDEDEDPFEGTNEEPQELTDEELQLMAADNEFPEVNIDEYEDNESTNPESDMVNDTNSEFVPTTQFA